LQIIPQNISKHFGNETLFTSTKYYIFEGNISIFLEALKLNRYLAANLMVEMVVNGIPVDIFSPITKYYQKTSCSMNSAVRSLKYYVVINFGLEKNNVTCGEYDLVQAQIQFDDKPTLHTVNVSKAQFVE